MRRFVVCIVAQMGLIGLVGLASTAQAGHIVGYAIEVETTPEPRSLLLRVDLTTAAATVIGSTGVPGIEGLAISRTGQLVGTDSRGNLYNLNATTGLATLIGNTHKGDIEGLTFIDSPTGSTLLGANFDKPTTIYSIDTTNANATPLVTTNPAVGPIRAMTAENSTTVFSVSDGPIYQSLTQTNLATGATSVLGTLHTTSSVIAAMAFGPNRTLYTIDASGREDTVDLKNGALTLVGNLNATSGGGGVITDLTIQSVPEPSSWVLAAIGVLVLAIWVGAHRYRALRRERSRLSAVA